jgi:hypothetical protein
MGVRLGVRFHVRSLDLTFLIQRQQWLNPVAIFHWSSKSAVQWFWFSPSWWTRPMMKVFQRRYVCNVEYQAFAWIHQPTRMNECSLQLKDSWPFKGDSGNLWESLWHCQWQESHPINHNPKSASYGGNCSRSIIVAITILLKIANKIGTTAFWNWN